MINLFSINLNWLFLVSQLIIVTIYGDLIIFLSNLNCLFFGFFLLHRYSAGAGGADGGGAADLITACKI